MKTASEIIEECKAKYISMETKDNILAEEIISKLENNFMIKNENINPRVTKIIEKLGYNFININEESYITPYNGVIRVFDKFKTYIGIGFTPIDDIYVLGGAYNKEKDSVINYSSKVYKPKEYLEPGTYFVLP